MSRSRNGGSSGGRGGRGSSSSSSPSTPDPLLFTTPSPSSAGSIQQQQLILYSVSVDSRFRAAGESSSSFTTYFGDAIKRAQTIELGSVYLPRDCLHSIQEGDTITFSEPITIPVDTTLQLQETTKEYDVLTNQLISETAFPVVEIQIPPTLNLIVSAAANGQLVTMTDNHGIDFVLAHYPSYNLRMLLVGGLFYNESPTVATATVASVPTDTTFNFIAGYLNGLVATPDVNDDRVGGSGGTAYLYAEPPTLSELLGMLNEEFSNILDSTDYTPTGTTLMLEHMFELDDRKHVLRLKAPEQTRTIGNSKFVTTSKMLAAGTLAALLGFTQMPADLSRKHPRQSTVTIGAYIPLDSVPFVRRGILRANKPTLTTIGDTVQMTMTPLDLTTATAANRTLTVLDAGGTSYSVVLYRGRYTGSQLAAHMQEAINTELGVTDYEVSYNVDPLTFNGRFTFTNTLFQMFSLNFTSVETLATQLGFLATIYTGSYEYSSVQDGPTSIISDGFDTDTFPINAYETLVDSNERMISVYTVPEISEIATNTTTGVTLEWETLSALATPTSYVVPRFNPNDIVQIQITGVDMPTGVTAGMTITGLVEAAWDGSSNMPNPYITMVETASLVGATPGPTEEGFGDPNADRQFHIVPLRRNVFQFHFSSPTDIPVVLGYPPQTLPTQRNVGQQWFLGTDTEEEANDTFYSPTGSDGSAQLFEAPGCLNLDLDYLLITLSPRTRGAFGDMTNVHCVGESLFAKDLQEASEVDNKLILCKAYIQAPYHFLSRYILHITQFGSKALDYAVVQIWMPDMKRLADFGGRNVTMSFLFTAENGVVSGACR